MRDTLAHRGPDGSGIEIIGNAALVHTRLAIVDLSDRAGQPMRHPDGWWLSFNGEIFNHAKIRQALSDRSFGSAGDTETLLHALARWDIAALPRLNGQFAFAAVDLNSGRLWLARDRFGIKPLYVAYAEDGLWFASEPAALMAAGIRPVPVERSFARIVEGSCYSGSPTLLRGVHRIRPGTLIEVPLNGSAATVRRWYSPAHDVLADYQHALGTRRRSALVANLEDTLRSAVHDALMGDVPVGALCSGGVDSALITALAREVKTDLVTFGARHRGNPAFDEGPAAERAADALDVEIDLIDVTEQNWRSGFAAATIHFGAPLANPGSVPVAQMAARARDRGIKVLLTGEGADELFGGYDGLHRAALTRFLPRRHRLIRAAERLVRGGVLTAVTTPMRRTNAVTMTSEPGWSSLTSPDDGDRELRSTYAHHPGPRGDLEAALLGRLDYTLGHLLNRMDKNAMQESVEARVPFLDPRVTRLALNLPLETRVGPWSKGILRDVARRLLPWSIAHRPKVYGLRFDAGTWIEAIANPRFMRDGLLRDLLQISTADFEAVNATAQGALRVRLWSTEIWCRSVLAGQALSAIEQELWPCGP